MKQFLVMKAFSYEDSKGFPEQGVEPIQDFDNRDDALAFIADQQNPSDFFIDDQSSDTVFDNDKEFRVLEDDEVDLGPGDEDDDEWDDESYNDEDDELGW